MCFLKCNDNNMCIDILKYQNNIRTNNKYKSTIT